MTGRFIFPALIFTAIATVLFIYIQRIWPIILAISVVIIALVYEQTITIRRIPSDWPRWKLSDTREVTQTFNIASFNSLIISGLLLMSIVAIVQLFSWPKVFLGLVLVFLVGLSSTLAGISGLRRHRKRELEQRFD